MSSSRFRWTGRTVSHVHVNLSWPPGRLGYISTDLRHNPSRELLLEAMKKHNKRDFEVYFLALDRVQFHATHSHIHTHTVWGGGGGGLKFFPRGVGIWREGNEFLGQKF